MALTLHLCFLFISE